METIFLFRPSALLERVCKGNGLLWLNLTHYTRLHDVLLALPASCVNSTWLLCTTWINNRSPRWGRSANRQVDKMVTKEVKAPSSFVFINYSDPAHDRLNKNNKHLVTKTATIHACRTRKRRTSSRSGLAVSPAAVSEPQIPIESDYTTLSTLHSSTSTPISLEESSSTSSPHSTATLATASTLSRGLLGSDNQYAETQELICTNHQTHERLHVGLSTALTCASTDPFDTLPVKPNQKIWKLLSSWLSAGARVNHAADDGYRTQVAEIRKAFYWPLLNRNKATFHAAGTFMCLPQTLC